MTKWRLYKDYFRGAGTHILAVGDRKIELEIADDGTFEFDGRDGQPLYAIAAIAGGKRDHAY